MADIGLKLALETRDAVKAVGDFQNTANKSLEKISVSVEKLGGSFTGLKDVFKNFAIGFAGLNQGIELIQKLGSALQVPIQQALEAEKSQNQLNLALAQTGQFSKQTAKDLQDYNDSLEMTTTFSADAITASQSLLQSIAKLDKEGLKGATQAALDLSATFGIDLQSAATLVGKAAVGNTTAFGKMGIEIKKGSTDAETFANTLKALSQFQGAAQAQTNTFAGALLVMGSAFNKLLESIGNIIVQNQSLAGIFQTVTAAFFKLAQVISDNGSVLSSIFIALTASATIFLGVLSVQAVISFASAMTAAGGAITVLGLAIDIARLKAIAFQATITLGISVAIGALIALFLKLREEFGSTGAAFEAFGIIIQSSLNTAMGVVNQAILSLFETLSKIPGLGNVFGPVIDGLNQNIGVTIKRGQELDKQLNGLKPTGINDVSASLEKMNANAKNAKGSLVEIPDELQKISDKFKNAGLSRVQVLQNEKRDALAAVQAFVIADSRLAGEAAKTKALIEKDFSTKILAERKKASEEAEKQDIERINRQKDRMKSLASGDITQIFTEISVTGKLGGLEDLASLGAGFVKNISQGAEGARKTMSSLVTAGATAMLGPMGGIVGQMFDLFSQGGEKVKTMVKEFVKAIPEITLALTEGAIGFVSEIINQIPFMIESAITQIPILIEALASGILGIFENIPSIVEKIVEMLPGLISSLISFIVERLPELIQAIIQALPAVTQALASAMPQVIFALIKEVPKLAASMLQARLKNLPEQIQKFTAGLVSGAGKFVERAAEGIKDAISKLTGGLSGGGKGGGGIGGAISKTPIGGLVSGAKKLFGFADGGLVPRGFPSDNFPANLTSGELVVDRSTTSKLSDFLNQNQGSQEAGSSSAVINLLSRIESKLNSSPIIVNVGGKNIATILREELQSGRVVSV